MVQSHLAVGISSGNLKEISYNLTKLPSLFQPSSDLVIRAASKGADGQILVMGQ